MTSNGLSSTTAVGLAGLAAGTVAGAAMATWWARRQVDSRGGASKQSGSSTSTVLAGDVVHIEATALRRVTADCLEKSGATRKHAELVADVLVAADQRNVPSHGVNRCEMYCGELSSGLIDGKAEPIVSPGSDGPSTCLVDGCNALGAVVSHFAMKNCIEKAKATGVGVVICCRSNHYGIAGYWAALALKEGLMGFSFTNTSPFMVPTRGVCRAVGTNPICCFCPAVGGDSFQLDMATTTVPIGKVEVLHRKGQSVPLGWGVDSSGCATADPARICAGGGLTPVGGMEDTAGYKGYGLGMLVEILCSVLGGCKWVGPDVPKWNIQRGVPIDYGHCFICIDPNRFASGFEQRLQNYLDTMRAQPGADPVVPVLVPGDPEKAEEFVSTGARGVRLNKPVAAAMRRLAETLQVPIPAELQAVKIEREVQHIQQH